MITIAYLVLLRISLYREGRQNMDSPSIYRVYCVRVPFEGLRITVACLVPKISLDCEGRQTMDLPLVH